METVLLICIIVAITTDVVTSRGEQELDFVTIPTSSLTCVTSLDDGGSIWKIVDHQQEFSTLGYFPLSQLYSELGCDQTPVRPPVVARSRANNIEAPVSFTSERQFTVNNFTAVTVYKTICRHGYVNMGDIIMTSSTVKPDVGDYRCVREELTIEAVKTRQIQPSHGVLCSVATSSGRNLGGFFSTPQKVRVLKRKPGKFEPQPIFVVTDDVICVGLISTIGSSDVDGSVWRPIVPPGGYYVIGHVIIKGNCDVTPPSIVIARSSGDSLAAPTMTSYTRDPTWSTNYQIFTCPSGYVSMGAVAIITDDDVTANYRCVKKKLTKIAQFGEKLLLSHETGAKVTAIKSDSMTSSTWKSNFFFATRGITPPHTYTLRNDPFHYDVINTPNTSSKEQTNDQLTDDNLVVDIQEKDKTQNHQLNISVTVGIAVGSVGILLSVIVITTVCYRSWNNSDDDEERKQSKSDVTRGTTPSSGGDYHEYASIDNELYSPMMMTSSDYDHIITHPRPLPPRPTSSSSSVFV